MVGAGDWHKLEDCIDEEDLDDKGCSHLETDVCNGVERCLLCGLEILREISLTPDWRHSKESSSARSSFNRSSPFKSRVPEDKNIYDDLKDIKYNIPFEIREKANEIYFNVTKGEIKRGKNRKALVCASVFFAFNMLTHEKLPTELLSCFNLTKRQISKGLNKFNLSMDKTMLNMN